MSRKSFASEEDHTAEALLQSDAYILYCSYTSNVCQRTCPSSCCSAVADRDCFGIVLRLFVICTSDDDLEKPV